MQDELIMYVRDKKNTPIGATYFGRTAMDVDGSAVVVMGWSKACKTDVFTKKTGREIANKRAIKAGKWLANGGTVNKDILLYSQEYVDETQSVPFIIKDNLKYYLDTAKDALGIEGEAIFVVPVLEKFVDITVSLMKSLSSGDADITDLRDGNKRPVTRTRYISVLY